MQYQYDNAGFQPPAPVVRIRVGAPGAESREELSALLDSGSDVSVVPVALVRRLGLRRVGRPTQVRGFGFDGSEVPAFLAEMTLNGGNSWFVQVFPWRNAYAILGRDVMNRWRTVLDGPARMTSIG